MSFNSFNSAGATGGKYLKLCETFCSQRWVCTYAKQLISWYHHDTIWTFTTHIKVNAHMYERMWVCIHCVCHKLRNFCCGCVQVSGSFSVNSNSCTNTFKMNWVLSNLAKKAWREVVFLLYHSLVPQRKYISHGWMVRVLSQPWPKSTGYEPLLAWLMSHWYSQLLVVHQTPSIFYIQVPLLGIPPILLLFESVWIHHFFSHRKNTSRKAFKKPIDRWLAGGWQLLQL